MSKITQASLNELTGLDLLPLGCLAVSSEQLTRNNGIYFTEESDDLDEYRIAALRLEQPQPMVFALRAYRGAPTGTLDLLLPAELGGTPALHGMILDITKTLRLTADKITWPAAAAAAALPPRRRARR
jgi:hypothetical protein